MKKTMRLAIMAAATVLIASCTQNELVTKPSVSTDETPVGFNVGLKNMTRASEQLENLGVGTFGVFAYKTLGIGEQTVMNNYQVQYSSVDAGSTWGDENSTENGKSYWHYDDLTGQSLKYWDPAATAYEFLAYVPYAADKTITADKVLNLGEQQDGTSPLSLVMVAKAADNSSSATWSSFFQKDVDINFKRFNGWVKFNFYSAVPGYRAVVKSMTVDCAVVSKGNINYDYTNDKFSYAELDITTGNMSAITFAAPAGTATTCGTSSFNVVTNAKNVADAASTSATDYYCMPSVANPANGAMTVTVSYTLVAEDTGETIEMNDKSVTIPVEKTVWAKNTKYTYVLKLTKGDLVPIVFDDVVVDPFDEVEYGDFDI